MFSLKSIAVGAVIVTGCASPGSWSHRSAQPASDVTVPLSIVVDLTSARWRGLSNIFLDSLAGPARDSVRMSTTWTGAALDDLVANSALRSIRILRFRTNADSAVPFADFRTGSLQLDGHTYAIRVRSSSRGHPFSTPNAGTAVLVDMNEDGQFAETATLTVDGRPVATEQAIANAPFELAGRFYEVVAIDSAGSVLRIRRSNRAVAVSPNRRAPELRAEGANTMSAVAAKLDELLAAAKWARPRRSCWSAGAGWSGRLGIRNRTA